MIRALGSQKPVVDPSAFVAWNADVSGDATIGEGVSVWYSATIRADVAPVSLGENSNVQDGAVIHADAGNAVSVGKRVTIGHRAILHGCTVEDDSLIGMGAIVLDGALIGSGSVIGAGALVKAGTVVPPRSLVVGMPGRVIRQITEGDVARMRENAMHYRELGERAAKAVEA